MADTEITTNLETAKSAVFDIERGVYAFGEYAELLIFVAAGARTHGNAQEALDRLATDMAERASELEGKYRELCRAVGINTGEELANG